MPKHNTNKYGERRHSMFSLFNSGISIEKFAAFLDGNLSADEMRDIYAVIREDDNFQQFMDVNSVVDDALTSFSDSNNELPRELQTLDFDLPTLEDYHRKIVPISSSTTSHKGSEQNVRLSNHLVKEVSRHSTESVVQNTTRSFGVCDSLIGNFAAAAFAPTSSSPIGSCFGAPVGSAAVISSIPFGSNSNRDKQDYESALKASREKKKNK